MRISRKPMERSSRVAGGGLVSKRNGAPPRQTGMAAFCFGLLLLSSAAHAQPSTTPAVLDHLLCYLTAAQPLTPQLAWLQDQFDARINPNGVETIYDTRMVLFCNPAQKTVISSVNIPTVPVVHPTAHMAMYLTTPQATAIPRSVPITNQFGAQTLITGEAEILGVPSGKTPIPANGGAVSLPPIPGTGVLDHFRCYSASGPSINTRVLLTDQFFTSSPESALVLTPRLFCNPVTKTVPPANCPAGQFCQVQTTPIAHPTSHMACYLISPSAPFQGVVAYNNQFVPAGTLPTVELKSPVMLCVPSSKSEGWTQIGSNPLAPGL